MPVKNVLRPIFHGIIAGIRALVRGVFALLTLLLGRARLMRGINFINDSTDQTLTVDGIKFDIRGWRSLERAATLLTKEPETIHWINTFIQGGDVLYDIGANVGVYSLYAAKKRGAQVVAFEPMALNYAVLNNNIFLNDLQGRIAAFNIALHDRSMIGNLDIVMMINGKAGNQFGLNPQESAAETVFRQGVFGMTLTSFVRDFHQPFPNHIKIDVDGNEPLVVDGIKGLLSDPRLKSMAVELNLETHKDHSRVLEDIKAAGFLLVDEPWCINPHVPYPTATRNYFFIRKI